MTKQDKELSEAIGGYSKDAYISWGACVAMLRSHGLTRKQIEAVLISKWTRWAGDRAGDHGKKYGQYSAKDLERWMNETKSWAEVPALTRETFGLED